jgi:hypothetical protein
VRRSPRSVNRWSHQHVWRSWRKFQVRQIEVNGQRHAVTALGPIQNGKPQIRSVGDEEEKIPFSCRECNPARPSRSHSLCLFIYIVCTCAQSNCVLGYKQLTMACHITLQITAKRVILVRDSKNYVYSRCIDSPVITWYWHLLVLYCSTNHVSTSSCTDRFNSNHSDSISLQRTKSAIKCCSSETESPSSWTHPHCKFHICFIHKNNCKKVLFDLTH